MRLDEYFLNSSYRNCQRSMKMYKENGNVLPDQTFLSFLSKKVNKNLAITSVALPCIYGMKLSHIIEVFHFKTPRLGL